MLDRKKIYRSGVVVVEHLLAIATIFYYMMTCLVSSLHTHTDTYTLAYLHKTKVTIARLMGRVWFCPADSTVLPIYR